MRFICFMGTFLFCVSILLAAVSPTAAEQPVVIGLSLSLSGKYVEMGKMQHRGYQLWREHINEQGGLLGRPVELLVQDDQSSPAVAQNIYRQMLEEKHVDLLFGPYSSSITTAILPLTEKYGFPILAAGASADSIWDQGYKHVFGVFAPASRYTLGFLELCIINDITRVALLGADDHLSASVQAGAARWAKELGMRIVYNTVFTQGKTNLEEEIKAVRDAKAQSVIMCGHFQEAVAAREAMHAVGWKPWAFYASVGPALSAYYARLGEQADGVFTTTQWQNHPALGYPGHKKFYLNFLKNYGEPPSYQAASAYAAGQILQTAVEQTRSLNKGKLSEAFYNLDILSTLGRYGVDSTGKQIRHKPMTIQWIKGQKEVVWPVEVQTDIPAFGL